MKPFIFLLQIIEGPMDIQRIKVLLLDQERPLKERFRALFTLKNLKGPDAVDAICECFSDPSDLLKHEVAFCLGQMQDKRAVPKLLEVLEDDKQEPIVRHEAGEALGAIGAEEALDILQKYEKSPIVEIAETCQLAVGRIKWMLSQKDGSSSSVSIYDSVDPTPPSDVSNIEELQESLLNENIALFERYRAMFSLRNNGSKDAVLALAKGLRCKSALFRHEIAYVLGQIQSEHSVEALSENLKDIKEHSMVRHECAEALGSIATPECMSLLKDYLADSETVVKESCEIALDMCDYANSSEFQYADGLARVNENGN